jgi:hypothetical protein
LNTNIVNYDIRKSNTEWKSSVVLGKGAFYQDGLHVHNKLRIFADCGPLSFKILQIEKIANSPITDSNLN